MDDEFEDTPGTLVGAGIVQIVAGIVNLVLMSWAVSLFWGTVGGGVSAVVFGICTLGLCPLPVGLVCGFAWVAIVPLALIEIVSGILLVTMGRQMRAFGAVTGVLEMLSVLVGNPVGLIAGMVSLLLAVMS